MHVVRGKHLLALIFCAAASLESVADNGLPQESLKLIDGVYSNISQKYVETVDGSRLVQACVSGMIDLAGPSSQLLDRAEFNHQSTGGVLSGVALELKAENGYPKVINPIEGGPAQRAGIQAGDTIRAIDDISTQGMELADVVAHLRGIPQSRVTLTIFRQGADTPIQVPIVRQLVRVATSSIKPLSDGVLYIRVTQFNSDTATEMVGKISQAIVSNHPMRGIVLDLRNNAGGVLDSSTLVASVFLPEGATIATVWGRDQQPIHYKAKDAGDTKIGAKLANQLKAVPIAVLINHGTAAGAEIVASSLQDNRRALVFGRPSAGQANIDTILSINDEYALKLTTARWLRANHHAVDDVAVRPDYEPTEAETADADVPSPNDALASQAVAKLNLH